MYEWRAPCAESVTFAVFAARAHGQAARPDDDPDPRERRAEQHEVLGTSRQGQSQRPTVGPLGCATALAAASATTPRNAHPTLNGMGEDNIYTAAFWRGVVPKGRDERAWVSNVRSPGRRINAQLWRGPGRRRAHRAVCRMSRLSRQEGKAWGMGGAE